MRIMDEKSSSNIDDIFDRYLDADTNVFANREVLSPHYVPNVLPHRDDKSLRRHWLCETDNLSEQVFFVKWENYRSHRYRAARSIYRR